MPSKQQPRSTTATGRATKAERKEQARRDRIELQRKMARARRNRMLAIGGLVVVGVAIVAVVALTSNGKKPTAATTGSNSALPGIQSGTAPWSNNTTDLAARLNTIKLPPAGAALHIHSHLDVYVNGDRVDVPADIGLSSSAESPLHTHDPTGVIHIESATANQAFTLGEFFDVWGVRLTSTCIGGYCSAGNDTLHVFVDEKPYTGDPRSIQLKDQQEIVIAYGTSAQVPSPLPKFDWSTFTP